VRRGDIVTVAAPGDFGKPRPAVVIQTDVINEAQPGSVIAALVTSTLRDVPLLRLQLEPTEQTGLQQPSQIMVDKLFTTRADKVGKVIGRLSDQELVALNRLLAFVIGIA
jgi:mRNA interferase MazF